MAGWGRRVKVGKKRRARAAAEDAAAKEAAVPADPYQGSLELFWRTVGRQHRAEGAAGVGRHEAHRADGSPGGGS